MEHTVTPQTDHQKFPCRECGAFLVFAPGSTHLKCPYCGTENEIEASTEAIKEIDYKEFIANSINSAEKQQIAIVKCTSCGAESSLKPCTSPVRPFTIKRYALL